MAERIIDRWSIEGICKATPVIETDGLWLGISLPFDSYVAGRITYPGLSIIDYIHVDEELRRKGIGTELLQLFIYVTSHMGCSSIMQLITRDCLPMAILTQKIFGSATSFYNPSNHKLLPAYDLSDIAKMFYKEEVSTVVAKSQITPALLDSFEIPEERIGIL